VAPGQYKLIVKAGEESIALDGLSVELGKDVSVRIVHKGDGFAVAR
jgi:hypothetical protein